MHHNPAWLRDLADQVDSLAAQVASAIIHAIQFDHAPPATVLTCELALWRWSWQLRRTPANLRDRRRVPDATPEVPRRVAVIHILDLTAKRDLAQLGREVTATNGPTGEGWTIVHTSVDPDPARLLLGAVPGTGKPKGRRAR